jgi:tRNA modification GTPase
MLVEATLDFPEEEIDFLEKSQAKARLEHLQRDLQTVLQKAAQGALLREGITVVIAGQPNAGKSSLLNALAGAELAIVTPVAGTTRDKVQQTIQIEGVPIHIVDTAGLRPSEDTVEQIGIEKAWEAIASADLVLFLHDLTRLYAPDYIAADAVIAGAIAEKHIKNVPVIDVWNKVDAATAGVPAGGVTLSAKTGKGLHQLRRMLLQTAGWQQPPEGLYLARERHVQALLQVVQHLAYASAHLGAKLPALDLVAEELRLAQNALGAVTGEFTPDDLLGVIFSHFCIGK